MSKSSLGGPIEPKGAPEKEKAMYTKGPWSIDEDFEMERQRPSGTTIVYPLYFGSESPFRRTYHGRSIVNDYDLIFKRLDSGMVECMGCTEANVKEWYGTPAQAEDHALQHELMGQWFRRLVLNLEAKNEIR